MLADKPHALSSPRDYLAPPHFPHPKLSDAALLPIPTLRAAAILLSPSDPLLPNIKASQLEDPPLQAITADVLERRARESNPRPPSDRPSTLYTMRDGLLYRSGRLAIPPTAAALILAILQQYHDAPMAGHFGTARTHALLA